MNRRTSPGMRLLRHVVLSAGAIVFLAPFAWMVLTSLKPPEEIFTQSPAMLPQNWAAIENYRAALTRVPLLAYLRNGVVVCSAILFFQILVALPAAYAFAKLEFGARADGTTVLGDEVLTPDSSRFWPADEWRPGQSQPSYDKQIVRNWALSPESGWDRASGEAPPPLPPEVVERTRSRYVEAYELLTGERF